VVARRPKANDRKTQPSENATHRTPATTPHISEYHQNSNVTGNLSTNTRQERTDLSMATLARQVEIVVTCLGQNGWPTVETPAPEVVIDPQEPILGELLRAMLAWEAPATRPAAPLRRIAQAVVDYNELRVCLTDELVAMLGERYPMAEERAKRIRTALNDIYRKQHAVTLEHLTQMPKRAARQYLESIAGLPKYAASRVTLLALGGHAAPVDTRLTRKLASCGLSCSPEDTDTVAAAIERAVRAGDMVAAFAALEIWSDDPNATTSFHGLHDTQQPTQQPDQPTAKPAEPATPKPARSKSTKHPAEPAAASTAQPTEDPPAPPEPPPTSRRTPTRSKQPKP